MSAQLESLLDAERRAQCEANDNVLVQQNVRPMGKLMTGEVAQLLSFMRLPKWLRYEALALAHHTPGTSAPLLQVMDMMHKVLP